MNSSNIDPSLYRVALYVRLSKEDEKEGPSQSIANQQSLLYEFVIKHHLYVHGVYVDDGFSGTSFDRPDFKRMIQDIEDKKVNMVITKDLSRLGRDYIMTGHYLERYFPEHQVRYISLLDHIDTGIESAANDIMPFQAIINDMYAKDISKKIKSVKHSKQEKGLFIGWKPAYGYKSHPDTCNKLVIDEKAASVVRFIFAQALRGVSCRAIADQLNDYGIPSPSAYAGVAVGNPSLTPGLWRPESIREMLKNEVYIGNMVQGRVAKVSYKSKKFIQRRPEDWIIVENTHEPIIDREVFRKIGASIHSRTRNRTYDYPLRGKFFCHECGAPLIALNRPNTAGEEQLYFNCRTHHNFSKAGTCSNHYVKLETVTQAVVDAVMELCSAYLDEETLFPFAQDDIDKIWTQKHIADRIQRIEQQLHAISGNIEQLYDDKMAGILSDEDFQRISQKRTSQQTNLLQQLNSLKDDSTSPVKRNAVARELTEKFIEGAASNRELLSNLLERVELDKDRGIYLKFRFQNPDAQ